MVVFYEMLFNNKLSEEFIINLSKIKQEPKWMSDFRLESYKSFCNQNLPTFGPLLDLDFNNINYFKKNKEKMQSNWDNLNVDVKDTFEELGIIKAEKEYLGGVGTQLDSEVIYHNMIEELTDKGVLFCDTDTALKKHPDIFKKYFNTLVKYEENKFVALNGSLWSGGTFIYIPPNTKLDRPLQSYFRINSRNMGQFERTLIIVDEGSDLHYIEGCSAPNYSTNSLHAGVVEIFVLKNAKCRYTTIQSWSKDVYNLVTKRAIVEEGSKMEWIDGNIGSKVTMKYPSCILKGNNSKGICISIAVASTNQIQDAGAKMIHLGKNTYSKIISKSIAAKGGNATYRGKVKIAKNAYNSVSEIKCDTLLLDSKSKTDTIPTNIVLNKNSTLNHEATVSKIDEEKLFYLMSRGVSKEKAKDLIIMGFIDEFKEELPLEYAVELNRLLKENL